MIEHVFENYAITNLKYKFNFCDQMGDFLKLSPYTPLFDNFSSLMAPIYLIGFFFNYASSDPKLSRKLILNVYNACFNFFNIFWAADIRDLIVHPKNALIVQPGSLRSKVACV